MACRTDVAFHPLSHRLLALTLIVALLALRLSSFTEQVFVEPVEDAIFDVPFIAAEDGAGSAKPIKVKTKRAIEIVLTPAEVLHQYGDWPQLPKAPRVPHLALKDIRPEIFIPPEPAC